MEIFKDKVKIVTNKRDVKKAVTNIDNDHGVKISNKRVKDDAFVNKLDNNNAET